MSLFEIVYTQVLKGLMDRNTVDVIFVQVCDTHELSTSIRTSLEKVMSCKFISRSRCYSPQVRSVFVPVSGSI